MVVNGERAPLSFTIHTWRPASLPESGFFEAGGHRASYVQCSDESDMIQKWATLMRTLGVDLYTGWSVDMPLCVRATNLAQEH